MCVDNRIYVKNWLVFGLVLVLVMPSALAAGLAAAPSPDIPAASRDLSPWWDYGWKYRRPVTIDNEENTKDLLDYPILVKVPFNNHMSPDFSDLRFAQYDSSHGQDRELCYWMENKTDGVDAYVWVNVSLIKASTTTTIHMYYGNQSAASVSDGEATFDFFDDFEGGVLGDGWTFWNPGGNDGYSLAERPGWLRIKVIGENSDTWSSVNNAPFMYRTHPDPDTDFAVQTKEDGTGVGASNRHSLLAYIRSLSLGSYNKGYWGAYMSTTSCKFESDGYRGNTAETGAAIHYLRFRKETSELYYDWSANRIDWFNGGSYSLPSIPDYWGLGGKSWGGSSSGGFNADFDYFFIRKSANAEPTVATGAEERPFKFLSATCSNGSPNEHDTVTINVTFNNPTEEPIPVNVSFWVGEDWADAARLDAREVALGPGGDTLIQHNWTAVGGDTVLWVAMGDIALASFPVSVNWLPVLDYIPDQHLMQDQPSLLRLTARDKGGEALNWSEDCPLLTFSKTNGTGAEISIKPTNDDVGVFFANFTVTDPHGSTDAQQVRFTVENINDPPRLEYIPNLVANEDSRFSYKVNASDPDTRWGDRLVFSDDCLLFDIDPQNGSFSFLPGNAQVGKYFVEISVRDNQSVSASRMFNLTVQNQNDPPSIEPIPPQTATQGKLWQAMARAADPDQATPQGDRLRFSDDSPLFDINPDSGLVSFTPANKDVGLQTCNITVKDTAGASCSTKLQLNVLNVNDPPALDAIPEQTATEEIQFEYTVKASDPDVSLGLDNLTFSDDSPLFDIDQKTGTLRFTPTNAQVGRHAVKITVEDESGATASRTFTLTVLNVNDPPFNVAITSLEPGAKFREGDTIWLNGTGSDVDAGDRLTFVWLDNNVEAGRGKSIQVKFVPGDHLVTLKVSDGNATVTAEVSIAVSKPTKEQVTVQNDWWLPLLVVVIAVAAAGGIYAVVQRQRRREPEELPPGAGTAAAGAVAGGAVAAGATLGGAPAPRAKVRKAAARKATGAGPVVAAAAAAVPAGDAGKRQEAKSALNSAEDAIADGLESGADVTEAMENLDIAKDFFKDGDLDEASTYAAEAAGLARAAAGKAGAGQARPDVGKLACPGCGEELNPEWGTCPVCGHKTR